VSKIPVFDIGDTLAPSRRFISNIIMDELRQQNEVEVPKYDPNEFMMYDPVQIQDYLDQNGLEGDPNSLVHNCRQKYMEALETLMVERDIFDFLAKCNQELGTIGIISDNNVEAKKLIKEKLEKHGIDYDGIVVSDEVGAKKPDSEIFEAFLKQREKDPEQFVYIGNDGGSDSGAKEVGMEFIWLTEHNTVNSSYDGVKIDRLCFEKLKKAIERLEK